MRRDARGFSILKSPDIDRLQKTAEEAESQNENWLARQLEAKETLEELRKQQIFLNPCRMVHPNHSHVDMLHLIQFLFKYIMF